jgi:predicted MPP superfamily phosphohydrolase
MTVFRWLLLLILIVPLGILAWGLHEARADPIVRTARIGFRAWPAGAAPVHLALLSDIHLGSLAMDPARLRRIVDQVDALHPDIIVLAGDFVAGNDKAKARVIVPQLVAPLAALRAPLGTVAVLGNHDEKTVPARVAAALRTAGITVLDNGAAQRGPLVLEGIGDIMTRHYDMAKTFAAARGLVGVPIAIDHGPTIREYLRGDVTVLLAGHTHCGQIYLPRLGIVYRDMYPQYRCGLVRQPGKITIVTAGVGTSIVPLRYNAPPDLWLIELGPVGR